MTTAPPAPLTATEDVLTALLAGGLTYKAAAERVGLSEATVYRRMCDPAFRGQVEAVRRTAAEKVYARLMSRLDDAAESLHLVACDAPDPADRIRAAAAILEQFVRIDERLNMERRLSRLEALAAASLERPPPDGPS